ncbi:eCIS core domain-containing protein [Calothrix sp. NIES-2098]|uniref:eCIS core domain-containing protein n=1 Tax=Calothrix sp. NIES-2098 TaxID=1954171 RepID=UPI0030DBDB60
MNRKSSSQVKSTTVSPVSSLSQPGILQRKCDCGGVAGLTGQCEGCNSKRLSGQGRVSNSPSAGDEDSQSNALTRTEQLPGHSFGRMTVQAKLPNRRSPLKPQQLPQRLPKEVPSPSEDNHALNGKSKKTGNSQESSEATRLNKTGLPDRLKTGIENLSGYSMYDVRVHYNSEKPAQLQAHAYTQGTEIYLGAGQEKHLPHEAWHVVQQMQGRVRTTMQAHTVNINADPNMEQEADVMGQKALQLADVHSKGVALKEETPKVTTATVQLIPVDDSDIGKTYEIIPYGAAAKVQGQLKEIRGGGWYIFTTVSGKVNVRGHENIIREITASTSPSTGTLGVILSSYNIAALSTSVSEFVINDIVKAYSVTPSQALQMIANSFGRDPRTIRIHYSFGSKTIAPGAPAFTDPSKTEKMSQAMVSYRKKDYPKHQKVGKDYDEWADELSDSEDSSSERQDLARRMGEYLTSPKPTDDFMDLSGAKRAALGGILTATQVSDRLRTYQNSEVTPMEFTKQIEERGKGTGTMHSIFGSKTYSTFLPARSGGSGLQREQLANYIEEIKASALLSVNNCLINAICQAQYGRNATMPELVEIRSMLGNVGRMLVASADTINVIRQVLHVNNKIMVRYPLGLGAANELFPGMGGGGGLINVYHTGGHHFQHNQPSAGSYDMS